jgi:HK97 family phage major capsid protein
MGVMGEVVKALGRDLPYRGASEFNCLCRHLLLGKGDITQSLAFAEADATVPRKVVETLKAAVGVGSVGDALWAGNLTFRGIIQGYVESLSSISFFDRALSDNSFVKVEMAGAPIVITTTAATGSTIGELAPTPLTQMAFSAPTVSLRKTITEVVISNEVARNPANTRHIGRELLRATAKAVDTAAIADIIAAGTSSATSGPTVAQLAADIKTALTAISIGQQSRLYWVLNATLAVSLAARVAGSTGNWDLTPSGGTLAGIPVVVSDAVPSGDLVLVDASRFAAFSDVVQLAASQEALVQMSTTPDSPAVASTVMVSLFQQNMTALRATRWWGIENLTSTASATITGMS